MKLVRCIGAFVAAMVLFSMLCAADVSARGRRGGPAVIQSPYYVDPYVPGFTPNPYIAPLPAYGILPPPLATYQMIYGYDPYLGGRQRSTTANSTDALDYVPRQRPDLYPAIPFGKSPAVATDPRRARFEITVPVASASVLFDGAATKQTGLTRVFMTPQLVEDKFYTSTIEVVWRDEAGTELRRKKTFEFIAGETVTHRFAE